MKHELADASVWTGSDLHDALLAAGIEHGDELEASLWGVPVVFCVWPLDAANETCRYADGQIISYVAEAYPTDGTECLARPQTNPGDCLAGIRRQLREYAPEALYDAWLVSEAIRTGPQRPLFEVPT